MGKEDSRYGGGEGAGNGGEKPNPQSKESLGDNGRGTQESCHPAVYTHTRTHTQATAMHLSSTGTQNNPSHLSLQWW